MSIVNELQEIAENGDILTVLRKTKRVSGKLGRMDILEWIDKEISGYKQNDEVPEYRKIDHVLAYNSNGYIPAGFGYLKSGVERMVDFPTLKLDVRWDIGMLSSVPEGKTMYEYLSPELEREIKAQLNGDRDIINQISLMLELPTCGRESIVRSVRDIVLDWAIKLESQGILGSKHSFTKEEKEIAGGMRINNFGTIKAAIQHGDQCVVDMQETNTVKKSWWKHVHSWYGILAGATSIISCLYGLHCAFGWWFFGL